MSRRKRLVVALAALSGSIALAACDALLTDPAPASSEIGVSFQIVGPVNGGTAVAFSKVRRAFLRFVRPDSSFRDTVVAVFPSDGRIRAALVLETNERIEALGIGARLGFGTTGLFEGAGIARIEPGVPTSVNIPLAPIPAAVVADRPSLTLSGAGATDQLGSAVLFASGDTIDGLAGTWTSADPTIVSVTAGGLATAVRIGSTTLDVRFDTLINTIPAQVVQPPGGGVVRWHGPGGNAAPGHAPGTSGVPQFIGLDFTTPPSGGLYISLTDNDPSAFPLQLEVISSLPAGGGGGLWAVAGGASIVWP